jgi:enterochelin esterase family protein
MPPKHLAALLAAIGATAQQAHVNLDAAPHRNTENLAPYGAQVVSPEVDAAGRVTLRLRAPQAASVLLAPGPLLNAIGAKGALAFSKDEKGLWTLTAGPVKPNIYAYNLIVDGVRIADPSNTVSGFGNQPPFSEVVVAGDAPAYYDPKPVPHGAITRHIYHSNVTNGEREIFVYTPPGYDRSKKYPVLYLLGGSGELASGWMLYVRANWILDNLIAEGKAKPMIIAMPNNQVIHRSHPQHVELTFRTFEAELRQHIVPFVDKHYSTRAGRKSRALSGLSMGGRHTQQVGFNCLDLFSSFAVLSAGDAEAEKSNPAFFSAKDTAKKVDYLFIGIGDNEEQPLGNAASGPRGSVAERSRALSAALKKSNIPHEFYRGGGGAHDWGTWRHLLHEKVLPSLWK